MTDFFTRLAERTLGAASLVQPLILPAFSPGPGIVETYSDVEEWSEPAPRKNLLHSVSAPNESSSPSPQVAAAYPPSTTEAEPSLPIPEAEGTSQIRRSSTEERAAAVQPAIHAKEKSLVEPADGSPDTQSLTPSESPRLEQQVILVQVASRLGPTRPTPLEAGRTEAERAPRRSAAAEPATLAGSKSNPPVIPPARRDVPSIPLVQTPPEASAELLSAIPPTESDVNPTPETIIRVSIGRVEVRLVPAPPPPPVKPVAMRNIPALSLDEYLRQRDEDRR